MYAGLLSMHAGYYLLVLACMILSYNAGQCNMHASLYYEYGMMLCINTALIPGQLAAKAKGYIQSAKSKGARNARTR